MPPLWPLVVCLSLVLSCYGQTTTDDSSLSTSTSTSDSTFTSTSSASASATFTTFTSSFTATITRYATYYSSSISLTGRTTTAYSTYSPPHTQHKNGPNSLKVWLAVVTILAVVFAVSTVAAGIGAIRLQRRRRGAAILNDGDTLRDIELNSGKTTLSADDPGTYSPHIALPPV